tara:strand:- start:45 stop:437 length:393 start_codon:yes stop_codon:yes gene_type:complete
MALVPTLTIKDTTTFSDEISFSVTDSLTVKAPSSSLSTIIADGTGANNIIVPAAVDIVYLFVRHTGFAADGTTGSTVLVDVEETGDAAFARLGAGEWLFMPFNHHAGNVGIQLQSTGASVTLEYAYWTKA